MKKILGIGEKICLFCGKPEKEYYEDHEKYYECYCEDAVLTRELKDQIDKLKRKFPQPKYKIINERVLYYTQ